VHPKQLYLPEPMFQGNGLPIQPCHVSFLTTLSVYSQAPKAVQAWKSELTSKSRTKIAAIVADPSSNPELFEEGWEEVLAREEAHSSEFSFFFLFFFQTCGR